MPEIELDPRAYRVKGQKTVRYMSIRPYTKAATWCGIWAAFWWSLQAFNELEPAWPYLVVAFAPIVVVCLTWLLRGGEASVEPPPTHPTPEQEYWQQVRQWRDEARRRKS